MSPVVVLLALGIVGARAQTTSPLRLERKIDLPDVEGRIDHMSIDVKAGRLFMAALGNDTVEVIDVGAGKRVQTVRGFDEPQGILVVPPIGRVFVANGRDGTVRVLDSSSFAPLQTVHLGDDADNLRLDPKTEHVWVGYGEGALAAIDAKGNKVMDVPLGGHPESFQLEKDGPRIFVNVPNAKRVAVVDRDKGAVVASWRTGDASANFPMALDEGNRRVFVVCRNPARLLVFDADSGTIKATLPTVADSDDIFYDSSAKQLYVSGGEGAVVVYAQQDADHYTQIARVPTIAGARTSLFSAELGRLFVAARRREESPARLWVYAVSR